MNLNDRETMEFIRYISGMYESTVRQVYESFLLIKHSKDWDDDDPAFSKDNIDDIRDGTVTLPSKT